MLSLTGSQAQSPRKYLVRLRDKVGTPYRTDQPRAFLSARAVQRRQRQNIPVQERDLPVSPDYVAQLRQAGATVWYRSRWLNAVLIEATDAVLTRVLALPCVTGLESGRSLSPGARIGADSRTGAGLTKFGAAAPPPYGLSQSQVTQLGVDQLHAAGYHGEGILIGVLDSGFSNANRVDFLKPLFAENRVLATYDFVRNETSVYEDDAHGLSCLSAIAATADGRLYGTAYNASFVLLRTEDVATESRLEEANWLFGAEYADSAGVDVISSSLGYTRFDDPTTDYRYSDMNGHTALSSRAAQIATQTGMVVVVAAGNEGASDWRYLSAPADAAGVLAVGAVRADGVRASFSSFGPAADGRVKPDLVARGQGTYIGLPNGAISTGNGTSFATPLLAGLAASFWQANPRLTAAQLTAVLRQSGSQFTTPDDALGYGIPSVARATTQADLFRALLAYPIPFSDAEPLTISWGELDAGTTLTASLADLTGRIVWQQQVSPPALPALVLPGVGLAPGLYVLSVAGGSNKRSLRVIKR